MNKKRGGTVFRAWCVLLAVLLIVWSGALYMASKLERRPGISASLSAGVTSQQLKQALEDSKTVPERYSAWNSTKGAVLENKELLRRREVLAAGVYGDMELAYPSGLLAGTYAAPDDRYGCVIDRKTAEELLGSADVLGMPVEYNGTDYYIRGITDSPEGIFLYRIGSETEQFKNLELVYDDVENGTMLAEDFLMLCGGYGGHQLLEGGFYGKIVSRFVLIPAQAAAFAAVIMMIVRIRSLKAGIAAKAMLAAAGLGSGCALLWLSGFRFYLPERMIPSRWSDLEFWSARMEEFSGWLGKMEQLDPVMQNILLRRWVMFGVLLSLIAGCLAVWLLLLQKSPRVVWDMRRHGFRYLAASLLLCGAAALFSAGRGSGLQALRPLLLVCPAETFLWIMFHSKPLRKPVLSAPHPESHSRTELTDQPDA